MLCQGETRARSARAFSIENDNGMSLGNVIIIKAEKITDVKDFDILGRVTYYLLASRIFASQFSPLLAATMTSTGRNVS